MTTTKLTKRDYFETIMSLLNDAEDAGLEYDYDGISDFCAHEIDLLDKKADKAKEHAMKKKVENDALKDAVYDVLTEDFRTLGDITADVDFPEVSTNKVVWRLKALIDEGKVEKTQITVPADGENKARKASAYRLIG